MEVMVVVAVIAVSTALMVPMYVNHTSNSRLKAASESLYNDTLRARAEALKDNANVTMVFQSGATWCYGLTTAANCDCNVASACNLGQTRSVDYSGTVTDLALTGIVSSVIFEGDRGTVSPTGSVTLTSSAGSISMELNSMGSPHLCSSNMGDYEAC